MITVFVGLIGAPLLRRREKDGHADLSWKGFVPLLLFFMVGILGSLNPSFKKLENTFAYGEKKELEILAKREFALGGNPHFINRVMREMYLFRKQVEQQNQDLALARFHLAYRYVINEPKSALKRTFERYLEDIRVKSAEWFPSAATPETSQRKLYLLTFVFLQGILVYRYLRERKLLRLLLTVLGINCVLIAIAGIWQKLAFNPNDIDPEIWGVWEAPEPRYFFASFTYKNHWCAYAVLGMGILAGLITNWLRGHSKDFFRGSPVPIALLGMVILVASAPLSGSVLGTILTLFVAIPFAGFFFRQLVSKSWGRARRRIGCLIAVSLPIIASWIVLASSPETKRETLQKISNRWAAIKAGQLPWRYYHSKDSWTMFMDKPVWGWGLGSTAPLYPLYASSEIIKQSEKQLEYAHHDERFFGLEHSHNDWFQYLAETGVIGVALLVVGPVMALRGKRLSKSVTLWALFACGSLLLYSFVDFPSRTPACSILFSVVMGAALKYGRRGVNKKTR